MNRYHLWLILALVVLSFFWSTKYAKPNLQSKISIDPIEETPEWLKLQVERYIDGRTAPGIWVPTGNFQTSSLVRVPRFPRKMEERELDKNQRNNNLSFYPISTDDTLEIKLVQNEIFSGQLVFISPENTKNLSISFTNFTNGKDEYIDEKQFRLRAVGYVPVQRGGSEYDWSAKYEEVVEPGFAVSGAMNPDIIADPLFDFESISVPAYRNQPIWLTVDRIQDDISGTFLGQIEILADKFQDRIPVRIILIPERIKEPSKFTYYSDHWLNPYSIADYYNFDLWSNDHWKMVEAYMKMQTDVGSKDITAIITEEPWRIPWIENQMRPQSMVGYSSMVKWVQDEKNNLKFDFGILNEYVRRATALGLTGSINLYSLSAFRGKERLRILDEQTGSVNELSFDGPEDKTYQEYWKEFLDSVWQNAKSQGWANRLIISFDERPEEKMVEIVKFLKQKAPQFNGRISIAGHPESNRFATKMLSISFEFFPGQTLDRSITLDVIEKRNLLGKKTSFYLCGQPAHPNVLTYSPAVEARIIPMIAARYEVEGSLRWAFNNWPKDIYRNPIFNFIQGDEYLIYPGQKGPVSSIRWELFRDGVEDFELYKHAHSVNNDSIRSKLIKYTAEVDGRNFDVKIISDMRDNILKHLKKVDKQP